MPRFVFYRKKRYVSHKKRKCPALHQLQRISGIFACKKKCALQYFMCFGIDAAYHTEIGPALLQPH
jgi:hypothetical protein